MSPPPSPEAVDVLAVDGGLDDQPRGDDLQEDGSEPMPSGAPRRVGAGGRGPEGIGAIHVHDLIRIKIL